MSEEEELYGTPDFSRVGLIDDNLIDDARQRLDGLMATVEEEMEMRGIPQPPRPTTHPQSLADTDITTLTNSEVASLYTQYVAYSTYIGDELARIEGIEESAKKMLKDTLAELKDAQFARGVKGAEATAAAMKDPVYQALDQEHMKFFFMKAILKRRYTGYVAQAAALSRTIELRKLDFEQTRRDGNVGFRANPVGRGFGAPKPKRP